MINDDIVLANEKSTVNRSKNQRMENGSLNLRDTVHVENGILVVHIQWMQTCAYEQYTREKLRIKITTNDGLEAIKLASACFSGRILH